MPIAPRQIEDRIAVGDDLYFLRDNGDGRTKMVPYPDSVEVSGTLVNHALLQPIENRTTFLYNRALADPTHNTFLLNFTDIVGYSVTGGAIRPGSHDLECYKGEMVVTSVAMTTPTRAIKAVVTANYTLAKEASLKFEVCNNMHDTVPTWEDATQAFLTGDTFSLTNSTKTDNSWGFAVRVTITNPSTTPSILTDVWGSFDADI